MKDELNIIIEAKLVRETSNAWLLDCEGDEVWFPKKLVIFKIKDNSLELPNWLYKEKFG